MDNVISFSLSICAWIQKGVGGEKVIDTSQMCTSLFFLNISQFFVLKTSSWSLNRLIQNVFFKSKLLIRENQCPRRVVSALSLPCLQPCFLLRKLENHMKPGRLKCPLTVIPFRTTLKIHKSTKFLLTFKLLPSLQIMVYWVVASGEWKRYDTAHQI